MLTRLQLHPFLFVSLHAVTVDTLVLSRIVESREADAERTVALVKPYLFGSCYVLLQMIASGEHGLVVDAQFGEAQVEFVVVSVAYAVDNHQSALCSEIYGALLVAYGSIIKEL